MNMATKRSREVVQEARQTGCWWLFRGGAGTVRMWLEVYRDPKQSPIQELLSIEGARGLRPFGEQFAAETGGGQRCSLGGDPGGSVWRWAALRASLVLAGQPFGGSPRVTCCPQARRLSESLK